MIRNANCKTSQIIKILNAHCASRFFQGACLSECQRISLGVASFHSLGVGCRIVSLSSCAEHRPPRALVVGAVFDLGRSVIGVRSPVNLRSRRICPLRVACALPRCGETACCTCDCVFGRRLLCSRRKEMRSCGAFPLRDAVRSRKESW